MEETRKEVGVGKDNVDDENDVDAKKRKVVAKLKAQISEAYAGFGDTVDTATRTRSTKSLSVKIKALANMLKKKTEEHQI